MYRWEWIKIVLQPWIIIPKAIALWIEVGPNTLLRSNPMMAALKKRALALYLAVLFSQKGRIIEV